MRKELKTLGKRIAASALAIATAFVLIPFGGKEAKADSDEELIPIDAVTVVVTAPIAGESATYTTPQYDETTYELISGGWSPIIASVKDTTTYHAGYFQYNKGLPSEDESYDYFEETSIEFVEGEYYYFEIFVAPNEGYVFSHTTKTNEYGFDEFDQLTVDINVEGIDKTEWEIGYCSETQIALYGKVKAVAASTPEAPADNGEVSKESPADNAMPTVISNSIDELKTLVLTDEDIAALEAGEDIKVYFAVTDIASTIDATEKAKVEEATKAVSADYSIGAYLNIDLFKQVGTTESAITNTNGKMKVTITLPETLQGDYTYKAVRVHHATADVLDATYNATAKTLTFESDQFSTYAIIYKKAEAATTTEATTAAAAAATTTEATTAAKSSPKTGDSALPFVAFAILGLSALAGAYSLKKFAK